MLLTTGAIALSRKIADKRAKEKEKNQGHLSVGSSDVAKRAFAAQTTKMIEDGPAGISRAGTDIKFEQPDDINATGQDTPSTGVYSPDMAVQDARSTSQVNVTSPVQSEKAAFSAASPYSETPTSSTDWRTQSSITPNSTGGSMEPPPYSPRPESSTTAISPSVYSKDSDSNTMARFDTQSIASGSTNSGGTHAIRVKTKGVDLKSGFSYHPALFDMRIHPDKWDSFTYQIIESTKFDKRDYTRMVGAATATALTGAIGTSVWVGRSMNRSIQEEKVRKGLEDTAEGGLGDTLKLWNEEYFSKIGVFVHMELSESAMKNPEKRSKVFRKPALMYSDKDDRARKVEERKFVLVVTRLDEEGKPSEAIHELAGADGGPVEIGSSGDVTSKTAELPGDEGIVSVELPAETSMDRKEKTLEPPSGVVEMDGDHSFRPEKTSLEPPIGFVEMDGDNSFMLEKMHLVEADPDAEKELTPKPLQFDNGSQSLDKETT